MTEHLQFLLTGHDTVECAYYLVPGYDCQIDYAWLSYEKEALRQSKSRDPKVITLGGREFLLKPYGTPSGYSFVIEDADFQISFSEFMSPSFFVKFKCQALWQQGLLRLHQALLAWAKAVGLQSHREESLSRVDFSFDLTISYPPSISTKTAL